MSPTKRQKTRLLVSIILFCIFGITAYAEALTISSPRNNGTYQSPVLLSGTWNKLTSDPFGGYCNNTGTYSLWYSLDGGGFQHTGVILNPTGYEQNGSFSVPLSISSGAHTLAVRIVIVAAENNICIATLTYTPNSFSVGTPPAVLSNLVAFLSPLTTRVGSPANLQALIRNTGVASTGTGFTNLFQIANDSVGTNKSDIGTVASSAFPAGQGSYSAISYTFPSLGTYYVRVCADKSSDADTGVITESSETDNCSTPWTRVSVVNGATASITADPTVVLYGGSSALTFNSSNAISCAYYLQQTMQQTRISITPNTTVTKPVGPLTTTQSPPGGKLFTYNFSCQNSSNLASASIRVCNQGQTIVNGVCTSPTVTCTSSPNACGQTRTGTIVNNVCNATPPPVTTPNGTTYLASCISSANACNQTRSNGTWQCGGSCSSTPPPNPANYGNVCTSSANACNQTRSNGTWQCDGSCSSTPPPNSNCPLPTASISISQNPVPYEGNPGFTLTSTNGYYCYARVDNVDLPGSPGYNIPSGRVFYHGPFTSSGTHTASAYCYNSVWSGSGWSTINFTVDLAPFPTVDLKINGSDGPLNLNRGDTKNITWTVSNALSCSASSNDVWSGNKSIPAGNDSLPANITSLHTLDCVNVSNVHTTDSVQVNVSCLQVCGAWSACSATCGGGTKTRSCTGTFCLPYTESQVCNTSACGSFNWKEVAP